MKPKANQQWKQLETGAVYTVFSNRLVWEKRGPQYFQVQQVRAYTHDGVVLLDGEGANGKMSKKPCHWVTQKEEWFVEDFAKV